MSGMVTVRWEDGSSITDFSRRFKNGRWMVGGYLRFCFGPSDWDCPDTPENRAALGMPPKEEVRKRCFDCKREQGDSEGFIYGNDSVPRCGHCSLNPKVPPAREFVELEGYDFMLQIFRDRIGGVRVISPCLIIQRQDSPTIGISTVPDTPRNRWVLRQAGIEVKE